MVEKEVKSKLILDRIGQQCMLRLFDFGGHDYYHDTHHVFFSKNSVYLLLWEPATNDLKLRSSLQEGPDKKINRVETQDYPLEYWLDSVKFYNKGVQPVNFDFKSNKKDVYDTWLLLIQNKTANRGQMKPLKNDCLLERYSFIFEFLNLSIINPKRNMTYFDSVLLDMLDNTAILARYYQLFIKRSKTRS